MTGRRIVHAGALAALLQIAGAASQYPPYAFVVPFAVPSSHPAVSNGSGYTPAPVPNQDLDDPARRVSGPARTELMPGLYQPHGTTFQGDGFTPNSTVQGEQQRHYHPAPALSLSVPLE